MLRPEHVDTDMVNHPPHYNAHPSGVEVITITEELNFCLGNAVKYILRADHKGNPFDDLKKAIWYLEREIDRRDRRAEEDYQLSLLPTVPRPEAFARKDPS